MAKKFGENREVDFAAAKLMSFGKSFSRMNGQPLDESEVWYDLGALQTFAASDSAYVGMKVVYVDTTKNKVYQYSIELDGSLKELGSSPIGDEKSITVAEDGTVSLYGIAGLALTREVEKDGETVTEKINYQPLLVDGKLTWVEPSATTVEGLALEIEGLGTRIGALETKVGSKTVAAQIKEAIDGQDFSDFVITETFDEEVQYLESLINGKADANHNHEGVYAKVQEVEDSFRDLFEGAVSVAKATNAENATTADSATKATQDGNGKVIAVTYETKTDANTKLTQAKEYAEQELLAFKGQLTDDSLDENLTVVKAKGDANGNEIHTTYETKVDARDKLNSATTYTDTEINKLKDGTYKAKNAESADFATSASSATKATQDAEGNVITDTYATKTELSDGYVSIGTYNQGMSYKADSSAVERVYAKKADLVDYSVSIEEDTTDSAIAKRYIFKQLGEEIGRIDLAKELVVTSGTVEEVAEADAPYAGAVVGDKYIKLVIANQADPIYIPAKDLVDIYTAKSGAAEVQVAISNTNEISATLVNGGVSEEKLAEAVKTKLNKAHEHDNKALLDTYTQTEANLADAVAKKHAHSFADSDVNDAISKKHSHSNATILDGITSGKVENWDDANSKKHEHGNKSLLDTYDQTNDNIKDAVSKKHSHANADVLNGITSDKVTAWDNAERNVIASIDTAQFNLDENRNLTLLDIAQSKISGFTNSEGEAITLANVLESKVDKVAGSRLITDDEASKLEKLVLGENGEVTVSGKVAAGNVDGLDTWITTRAGTLEGLSENNLTDALLSKLNGVEGGAEVNVIDAVDTAQFNIDGDRKLTLLDIAQEKVIGLKDALAGKVDVVEGKGLSSNDFTDTLLGKLNGIESGAQVNVIEGIKFNGTAVSIEGKVANITYALTTANADTLGGVKSDDAENKISVAEDGTMSVNSINVNKFVQTEGEYLILNGGSASV